MGKIFFDCIQGEAGYREGSWQVSAGGFDGIRLLFFPGKKKDLQEEEPELRTASTNRMQLVGEFCPVQIALLERLQPRQQLGAKIRPKRPCHFIAGFIPHRRNEVVDRRSGNGENEWKALKWDLCRTHQLDVIFIATNRVCQSKTQPIAHNHKMPPAFKGMEGRAGKPD